MVAAPESISQSTVVPSTVPAGKLANGVDSFTAANNGTLEVVGGQGAGVNGANEGDVQGNGFAAVASEQSEADLRAAKAASARSHNSNFDPTPSASANIPPPEIARNIPCRYFPIGKCKYGDGCAFSHAGVAGVAAPAVHQQHAPAPQQQQVQVDEYSHEAVQGGMPMYYPPQMNEHGHEYAYPPQFQQGYYPFPPPFQHYYQQPPPQQFYQHPPQHAPQMHPEQVLTSPSPSNPITPATEQQPQLHAPTSPDLSRSLPPLAPATFSPPPPQGVPLLPGAPLPYAQYPSHAGPEYTYPPQVPSSPTAFGPDATRAQSLHTFFQTGVPAGAAPLGAVQPAVAPASFPKTAAAAIPRLPAGPRRAGPPGALGASPFGRKPHPPSRYSATRPPCSFFEANRCRHGDTCNFAHLLPDGSDARLLAQGLIGIDGRTAGPEERGGMPPAWIQNPHSSKFPNRNTNNRASMNGGYSAREPTKPRTPFQEEMRARQGFAAAEAGVDTLPAVEGQIPKHAGPFVHLPNGPRSAFPGRVPGAGAPAIVAAIQGLTRGIPAAPSSNPAAANSAPAPAAPAASRQRVPSTDDFPALSVPGSPTPKSPLAAAVVVATPVPSVAQVVAEVTTPAAVPTTTGEPWSPENGRDGAPSTDPVSSTPAEDVAAVPMRPSPSEHSDSDFVIITHDDASATPSAPAAPIVVLPTPAPVRMGYAGAAARGAAIPAPVVPERARKVVVAPVSVKVEEVKEAPVVKKGKGKSKGERREPREPKAAAPIAIKA